MNNQYNKDHDYMMSEFLGHTFLLALEGGMTYERAEFLFNEIKSRWYKIPSERVIDILIMCLEKIQRSDKYHWEE